MERRGPGRAVSRQVATVGTDRGIAEMHAALDVNLPNYASAIVTTTEIVDAISSL